MCVSWRPRIRISQRAPDENKRHDRFPPKKQNWHQRVVSYAAPADEVRQLQDVRPPWPGLSNREGFALIHASHAGGETRTTRGAFPSFFWGCMMKEQLSSSPLAVKHKVSGSERGTPTFISLTAIPVGDTKRHGTQRDTIKTHYDKSVFISLKLPT